MAYDPQDDVDRLFACFKCGVSTPESAVKESRQKASSRRAMVSEVATPNSSKQCQQDSAQKERNDENIEDCSWWTDVEMSASQIEQQLG